MSDPSIVATWQSVKLSHICQQFKSMEALAVVRSPPGHSEPIPQLKHTFDPNTATPEIKTEICIWP
jgi:hypothetical protein